MQQPTLRGEIGFWMTVSLVMGNMIGSGIFLLPASLAPHGGLSLVGWLLSTTGSVLLALVFARLTRFNPAAGGPYAFTRQSFGELAGFLVAWGYWISIWCTNAAIAVAFVGYLGPFAPALVRSPVAAAAVALAAIWLLTGVNAWGVRAAARVQVITTALKILPLVGVGLAGLAVMNPAHFAITPPAGGTLFGGVTASATLTLWAFLGLESGTVPADRVAHPHRTIPRATVTGTLLVAAIYIGSTVGVMGVLDPATLGTSTAPFAEAAQALGGAWAGRLVALGAAVSCFGALNGWILLQGQLPAAAARDGLFPAVFARLSPRGTPARGLVLSSLLTTALIGANYSRQLVELFTFIILLATLNTLVPYVFCSLAAFVRGSRGQTAPPGAAHGVVAALAFAYSMWAIAGAGMEIVYWGFLLLLAGLPVYVGITRGARA